MHVPRLQPGDTSDNSAELREVFVRRVHRLIQLGYERLTPAAYAKTQEPAITGELVDAIDGVLSDCAEDWMIAFSVHDDPPVNDGRRKGKQRKRVDLRIDSGSFRPRARFRFEAKRLGKGHPVTVYLGSEGLGCFLRGDYAREEDHAGMLGYVQSGELDRWGEKIAAALNQAATKYDVDLSLPFGPIALSSTHSLRSYQSKHKRSTVRRRILIDHILMWFQ